MANKKESTFTNMVVTLFIVTFIASATLGEIYELTKEPIQKALNAKKEASIKKVLPEFDKIKSYKIMPETGVDSIECNEAYKNNELIGVAVETYTDNGFSGRFKIMVGFLPDGDDFIINNTAILEHKETPGLGDKMDEAKSMKIGVGSNDGVRMWLNGELVLDQKILRTAEPNQEILTLPFKKGENSVLIKIDQFGGGWGFYFSLLNENY